MDIAKNFSAYFSNLAENLVRNLPIPWHIFDVLSVSQYCSHLRLDAKFDLLPKEKDYVLKILRDISTSKSVDILPGRFLKDGADVLAKPVPDICNLSISFNKFPSAFKSAKVKPIFIKGRKTNASSYRYYLLLPILSKVIEKVVHEQTTFWMITIFFSVNINLASELTIQQTYFYHFSITKLWKALTTECTGTILIDLQKAFYTINHKILLDKLLPIGLPKNAISWLESYLTERHFTVEIANRVLKFPNISYSAPQVSILGPLLCSVYINDMSQTVECNLYLYADDSCLLFQHKNVTKKKNS